MEIVEDNFRNDLYRTDRNGHFYLTSNKKGYHHSVHGTDYPPRDRFQNAFEMFVFASVADKPFFDRLIDYHTCWIRV